MVSSIRTPQSEESFSIPHSAFRIPHSAFEWLLGAQRLLDRFLESAEGLRAGEEQAVHDKRRRAIHAHAGTFSYVFAHGRCVCAAVQTGVKLRRVKLKVRRKL